MSPQPIGALNPVGPVVPRDPPLAIAGESIVELDTSARLLRLHVVPDGGAFDPAAPRSPPPDWAALFRAAGLEMTAFTAVRHAIVPPVFADDVQSWQGASAFGADLPVRVHAASLAGRPVWFDVSGPWSSTSSSVGNASAGAATATLVSAILSSLFVLATVWLAIVNLREDRADRDGAFRVAAWAFGIYMLRWLLYPAHQNDPTAESFRLFMALGYGLLFGVVLGGAYLGLEPFVRRHWPLALVSWTRLIGGRWRDPLVGRDVLIGLIAGLAGSVLAYIFVVAPPSLGGSAPSGWLFALGPAEGLGMALATILFNVNWSLVNGLLAMFIVAAIRRWVRPIGAVAILAMIVFGLLGDPETRLDFAELPVFAVLCLVTLPGIIVLFRYGLLAGAASALAGNLTSNMVFTLDPARGYFEPSLLQAGVVAGAGLVAWRLSRSRLQRT
jgi:serine/threonine-protein kinase